MNAENAEYQILLSLQSSHYRSRQLDSLRTGISAVSCSGSSRESRTILAVSFYLTLLAERFEKLLCGQCNQALQQISRFISLPDQLQWEFRSAFSLGVAAATTRLGLLQEEIIASIRLGLCDASALIMAQAPDGQLSIQDAHHCDFPISCRLDLLDEMRVSVNPRCGKKMIDAITQATTQCRTAVHDARVAADQPSADRSISSICAAGATSTEAEMLAAMMSYCQEATAGGGFADEPAVLPVTPAAQENELILARLLCAGFVAAKVSNLLKKQNPTIGICLN